MAADFRRLDLDLDDGRVPADVVVGIEGRVEAEGVPRARMTSASRTRRDATGLPRGPIWPAFSGCPKGMASPWPGDIAMGAPRSSARAMVWAAPPLFLIPPPATMTGRSASSSIWAACATAAAGAAGANWTRQDSGSGNGGKAALADCTSRGRFSSTGPRRGVRAVRNPAWNSSGIRWTLGTVTDDLVTGDRVACWSTSWNASRQTCAEDRAPPTATTSGICGAGGL